MSLPKNAKKRRLITRPNTENSKNGTMLGPYDIIFGRSSAAFNNIGNRRFRVTISMFESRYCKAKTRKEKSLIFASVVKILRESGARFLAKKGGSWIDVGDKRACAKVGHALRDLVTHHEMRQEDAGSQQYSAEISHFINTSVRMEEEEEEEASTDVFAVLDHPDYLSFLAEDDNSLEPIPLLGISEGS